MSASNRIFDTLALAAIALLVTLAAARASAESVDQATKTALRLDAHVKHGRAMALGSIESTAAAIKVTRFANSLPFYELGKLCAGGCPRQN